MRSIDRRMRALEKASGDDAIVLHFAKNGHDHGAEWRRLIATGKRVRAVVFRGINREATDAFIAAMPEGARI